MSDYQIIGPREDGYIAYEEGYYMGIMDKEHSIQPGGKGCGRRSA